MNIYSNFESIYKAPRQSTITIGVFDGCHLGHKALLQKTLNIAKQNNQPAGVITFSSHPNLILQPEKPLKLLISPEARIHFFEKMGFDFAIIIPFDEKLRHTSAERFINTYLINALEIQNLVLGYDTRFGDGRRGDINLARKELNPLGINVEAIKAITINGNISSTRIRQLLSQADLTKASELLGYNYKILGKVGHGDKRGRKIGFPTANVIVNFDAPIPEGVWAVKATVNNHKSYLAAAHWGPRPTFTNANTPKSHLEVHLINFQDDIYGANLEIEFIKYIRKQKQFDCATQLASQIAKDIHIINQIKI